MHRLIKILLGLWLAAGVMLGGVLLLQHLAPLPVPDTADQKLRERMARAFFDDGHWRVMHVLYRPCPCSKRTIEHLTDGPRPVGLDELVLMIDDDGALGEEDQVLRDHGYRVEVITPATLGAQFDLQAAPVLVIARPDGTLAYIGGYNRHKQSGAYEDLELLAMLRNDRAPAALPVFGCPTSAELARQVDPLGLGRR